MLTLKRLNERCSLVRVDRIGRASAAVAARVAVPEVSEAAAWAVPAGEPWDPAVAEAGGRSAVLPHQA